NSLRNINGTNPGGRECCHPSAMLRLGVGGVRVIDLVTFSADIVLREARGTELPVVEVPVTLETAAYEPRIVSMSIRPSVIEIEPGVDRQAVAAVEVELPDAGLPPELNPGVNVTVSLYRVDGHGSVLVETTPCCPGVCCRTEFVADGGRATFVFTLDPVEATVPAGEWELRFEARIGNRLCVLPLADTHPDRSETGSLLLSRGTPPATVQIQSTSFVPSDPAYVLPGNSSTLRAAVKGENIPQGARVRLIILRSASSPSCVNVQPLAGTKDVFWEQNPNQTYPVDFLINVVQGSCPGSVTYQTFLEDVNGPYQRLPAVDSTATLNVPGLSVNPTELDVATGGQRPTPFS
ncbi:MAG: hypothetical protein QXD59_05575, partial [Candidatus Caldarchaeum sp.]